MRKPRLTELVSLLVILLIAVVAAGALASPASAAIRVKHVSIQNSTFTPRIITIRAGTKVVWKNMDAAVHTVASTKSIATTTVLTRKFRSGPLSKGAVFSFTFRKRGTFFYECTIHASMRSMHGKIIVK